MIYRVMEEDYPKCKGEMVKSCMNSDNTEDRDNLVDPDDCREVMVTRCKIARRKVRKAQPDTRCERVPTKTCLTHKCEASQLECEETVKMMKDLQPQESCSFIPRRVCQEAGGSACRTAVTRVCRQVEGGGVRMQLVCNGTLQGVP